MTAQLTRALAALREEFADEIASGDIRHLGTTNCRYKNNDPDDGWSEHAWPNAVDVMLRNWSGRRALGDRIARWMRDHPELWSEVFWQIAAHFDHVHGTATPRRNYDNKQVPPCAGGPDTGDDMPTAQEIAEAVWSEIPAEALDAIAEEVWLRLTRDTVTGKDLHLQTHLRKAREDAHQARIDAAVSRRLLEESGTLGLTTVQIERIAEEVVAALAAELTD